MKILAQDSTDEPNGTAVQIPARRDDDCAGRGGAVLPLLGAGSVLVDGQEPKPMEGIELSPHPHRAATRSRTTGSSWATSPTQPSLASTRPHSLLREARRSVVARVEIGAVNFTPSRESLMDTDTTKATQKRIKSEFEQVAARAVKNAVEARARPGDGDHHLHRDQRRPAVELPGQGRGHELPGRGPALLPAACAWANQISRSGHKHGMTYGPPEVLARPRRASGSPTTRTSNWTGSQRNKLQAYMERHMPDVSSTSRAAPADARTPPRR